MIVKSVLSVTNFKTIGSFGKLVLNEWESPVIYTFNTGLLHTYSERKKIPVFIRCDKKMIGM